MTTAGAPRTLRRDAAENRRRVLDAAGVVFAEHGLEAGVEEIARVAGVGMGTLYRRFPTKDALIAELIRELLSDVLDLARAAREVPGGAGLEQFLYGTGSAQVTHRGCLARMWSDPESTAIKIEIRTVMAELLADAQSHGQVRQDAELSDIDLLFWSLRGIIEATQAIGPPVWRRHVALVVAGLRPSEERLPEQPMSEEQAVLIKQTAKFVRSTPITDPARG